MVLGILVIIVPFIGLPYSWLMWILPVLGALVVYLGSTKRRRVEPAPHETEPLV